MLQDGTAGCCCVCCCSPIFWREPKLVDFVRPTPLLLFLPMMFLRALRGELDASCIVTGDVSQTLRRSIGDQRRRENEFFCFFRQHFSVYVYVYVCLRVYVFVGLWGEAKVREGFKVSRRARFSLWPLGSHLRRAGKAKHKVESLRSLHTRIANPHI